MIKVHLDTDLGGDIDDICALALLLKRKDVQITGVTTVCDNLGQRAGYARYVLDLEGRREIPVAAGAEADGGYFREPYGLPPHDAYWSEPVAARPGPVEAGLELIKNSLDQGALIAGIGPFTNLRLFGEKYPGYLEQARLFLMGGFLYPARAGFPQWGNEMDFNVQADVRSAHYAITHGGQVTLIPLAMTEETALRRAYLPALRRAGGLASLIAAQAEAFAVEYHNETLIGGAWPGVHKDLINFQHDPLACAIALGWDTGAEFEEGALEVAEQDGWLVECFGGAGRPVRVLTRVDGEAFSRYWVEVMTGEALT
jgi:purine nucleosidase